MVECSLAVMSFLPKLAKFRIANFSVPLFSCLAKAKDGLTSMDGEAVKTFFRIGFNALVRVECRILKNVKEYGSFCSVGIILIFAISMLRLGLNDGT